MLKSLKMPKRTVGENPMRFPIPTSHDRGTVTVLCGPNGSGKSFILRSIALLLWEGQASASLAGWKIEVEGEKPGLTLKPKHHKAQMNSVGSLTLDQAAKTPKPNDDELKLKIAVFGELLASLDDSPLTDDPTPFDAARWNSDSAYRSSVLNAFPDDEMTAYPLRADAPEVFKLFEAECAGRLGLRRAVRNFETVLAWPFEMTAPFDSWSDGQKSLFTILMSVTVLKPDVYLFDELENFFHPQLISRAVEFLKTRIRQVVLTSHHPHLIFGRAVDRVFYVELDTASDPRFTFRMTKYPKQPAVPRRITELTSNLEKLASAYRLFDMRDAALLATATHVSDALDLSLNAAVLTTYGCAAVPGKSGIYMDRQTEDIAAYISSFHPAPRSVLDWGAGLGRTMQEMQKSVGGSGAGDLDWILFEPDTKARAVLNGFPRPVGLKVRIIGDRTELAGTAAGVALLTNVLHVLNPEQWAEAIEDCWEAVRGAQNGVILVTELFPLLAPERFAVPVQPEILEQLFVSLGFKVHTKKTTLHNATAFCTAASAPPATLPTHGEIVKTVEQAWRDLRTYFLRSYSGMPAPRAGTDKTELMNSSFGIATVTGWLEREGRV